MPEARTEAQIQADLNALAERFNNREIEDLGEFQAEQQKLAGELASVQTNAQMAKENRKHARERNERVYSEVLKERFGKTLAEVRKNPKEASLQIKFFESLVLSHQDGMADASADGESAVRQWLSEVADIVDGEVGAFNNVAKDATGEGEGEDDSGPEGQPERPEPTDISDIPESGERAGAGDLSGVASQAFAKMLDGNEYSDEEAALIGRDIEIGSFEDRGLPIKEQESFWGKRSR